MKKMVVSFSVLFITLYTITAESALNRLNFRIIDAEYSKSLNRIISVSANPSRLHVYDPISNSDIFVNLPLAPSSVSVSPDGLFAAVGHNARISYVDLQSAKLVKILNVSADLLDVVLAGNGFVYAFPKIDQWQNIHSVNISLNKETLGSGLIYAGTVAKLHPSGKAMYGANNGLSPSDIEKYNIATNGVASIANDSPYHGDFAMCGNLWMSEDGLRIFTACGNVFRASTVQSEDMIYNGKFSNTNSVWFAVHSKKANRVAVIAGENDKVVQLYGYGFLQFLNQLTIPNFVIGAQSFPAHGRFVFYNSDSSKLFVIAQADATSGLLNDFGVTTFETGLGICDPLSPALDCDFDGITNNNDNCTLVPNKIPAGKTEQLDSDNDNFGNICDPDLNNDTLVNGADFNSWIGSSTTNTPWLSSCGMALYDAVSDFNGDCKIDNADSSIFLQFLFKKPGPSCMNLPVAQKGPQCH